MTVKVSLEYPEGEVPEEILALEQHHNAGQVAQEVGYQEPSWTRNDPAYQPTAQQLEQMEKHAEDFQFHNAGRPAVTTGGGQQLCEKMEWDPDLTTH